MMRIGVICEGRTDFHAIESFFGHSLKSAGIQPDFEAIQPTLDETQSKGGWGNVLLWLDKNLPAFRMQEYLNRGVFREEQSAISYDCLLIHLDSDILDDIAFGAYIDRIYGYSIGKVNTPLQRAREIRAVISHAARFGDMTKAEIKKHVPAPAVESTETWCVAAFTSHNQNFESLSGQQLINAFMSALERSEGKQPETSYGREANKDVQRRERYCKKLAGQSNRIINGCPQFKQIHQDLLGLVPS